MKKLLGKATIAFAVLTFTLFSSVVAFAATTPAYQNYLTIDGHMMKFNFNGTYKMLDTTDKNDATQDYYSLDNKTWLKVVGPMDVTDMIGAAGATQKFIYYKEDVNQVDPYIINIPTKQPVPDKTSFYVDYSTDTLSVVAPVTVKMKVNRNIVTLSKGDSVSLEGSPSGIVYWAAATADKAESVNGTYSVTAQAAAPNVKFTFVKGVPTLTGITPTSTTIEFRAYKNNGDGTYSLVGGKGFELASTQLAKIQTNLATGNYRYEFRTKAIPASNKPFSKSVFVESVSNPAADTITLGTTSDSDNIYLTGVDSSMEYSYDVAKAGKITPWGTKAWIRFTNDTVNANGMGFLLNSLLVDKTQTGTTTPKIYVRKYVGTATTVANAQAEYKLPIRSLVPTATYATSTDASTVGKYVVSAKDATATYEYKDLNDGTDWTPVDKDGSTYAIPLTADNISDALVIRTQAAEGDNTAPSLTITKVALDDTTIKAFTSNTTDKLTASTFAINYKDETLAGFNDKLEYAVAGTSAAPKSNEYTKFAGDGVTTVELTNLLSSSMSPAPNATVFGKKVYVRYAAQVTGSAVKKPTAALAITIPARPAGLTAANVQANFNTEFVNFAATKAGAAIQYASSSDKDTMLDASAWTTLAPIVVSGKTTFAPVATADLTDTYALFRYAAVDKKTFASASYSVLTGSRTATQDTFGIKIDYDKQVISHFSPKMEYRFIPANAGASAAPAFTPIKASQVVKVNGDAFGPSEVGYATIALDDSYYGKTLEVRYAKTVAAPASASVKYPIATKLNTSDLTKIQGQISALKSAAIGDSADQLYTALSSVDTLTQISAANKAQYFSARVAMVAACSKAPVNELTLTQAQAVLGSLQNIVNKANASAPAPILATSVSITPATVSIGVGGTTMLTPVILPSYTTNTNVTWSSSNTSVATVANGIVTGVASGSATITVTTSNGKTGTSVVTVVKSTYPANVASVLFTAQLGPVYGIQVTVDDAAVTTGVASVKYDGKAMTKKSGTNNIYVTSITGTAPTTDAGKQDVYDKIVVTLSSPTAPLPQYVASVTATAQLGPVYGLQVVVAAEYVSSIDKVTFDGKPMTLKGGTQNTYVTSVTEQAPANISTIYSRILVTLKAASYIDTTNSHVSDLGTFGGVTAFIFLQPGVSESSVSKVEIASSPAFTLTSADYNATRKCYIKALPGVVKDKDATTISVTVTGTDGRSETKSVIYNSL